MNFTRKLIQAHFNLVYNPVYDFTTGKLDFYRKLQAKCIGNLDLKDNDKVLCVGIGTGNEIFHILQANRTVRITGVDYSTTALHRAYRKALRLGKEIELRLMDARNLEFATESFDKVLCLHVMDFIQENGQVTSEIIRVLKHGGQFVTTYPSEKEGAKLGSNIMKESYRYNINSRNYVVGLLTFLGQMLMGLAYLPLVLRKRISYSYGELQATFSSMTSGDFHIEEFPVYQDFIVSGKK